MQCSRSRTISIMLYVQVIRSGRREAWRRGSVRPAFSGACVVMGLACLEGEYAQCLFYRRDGEHTLCGFYDDEVWGCLTFHNESQGPSRGLFTLAVGTQQ